MVAKNDFMGFKIGQIEIIAPSMTNDRGRAMWKFRCDCSRIGEISSAMLRDAVRRERTNVSCGHQVCDSCHMPFIRTHPLQKNCSMECRLLARERTFQRFKDRHCPEMEKANCVICGVELPLKRPFSQKTCSAECKAAYRANYTRAWHDQHRRPWRICVVCGVQFRNQRRERNQKICSLECRKIFKCDKAKKRWRENEHCRELSRQNARLRSARKTPEQKAKESKKAAEFYRKNRERLQKKNQQYLAKRRAAYKALKEMGIDF